MKGRMCGQEMKAGECRVNVDECELGKKLLNIGFSIMIVAHEIMFCFVTLSTLSCHFFAKTGVPGQLVNIVILLSFR